MDKIYYGAALYPELWDMETNKTDIAHMKRLGMNLARIGEFAWSTYEPEQDQFDFTKLTEALDLLAEYQIDVIVCTPTPTPPIWLTDGHPERLHQNKDGQCMYHGSRQHICTNHPFFRERAAIITEKLAQIVARYDHVIAIQLDNEFKCHIGPCYCDNCKRLWSDWLKNKYQTIDNLNTAWGTAIWSQTYLDFSQVVQPLPTPFLHNSALVQNYHEFTHDKIAEFAKEQADTIRTHTTIPITHNTSMFFDLDNEKLAEALDYVSFDTYTPLEKHPGFIMNQDRWKYLKNETRDYMLLETSTSYNGHLEQYGKLHEPGYVKAESFATFASGGSAFCYWLFRGQRSGCEQPHGSVVSSWGDPTIGYQNVVEVSELIKQIEPYLHKTKVLEPRVAITYSDRARSFIDVEHGSEYVYKDKITDFYKLFLELNLERKLVPEGHDLSGCHVLFTPYAHHLSDSFLSRVLSFIEHGGVWIAGPMTGDRTGEHTWPTEGGLGSLTSILGIKEMIQFPATNSHHYGEAFGLESELLGLSSFFEVDDETKVLGKVTKGQGQGKAFLIEKKIGKGKLVMLGSQPDDQLLKTIIHQYTAPLIHDHAIKVADQIMVFPRQTEDKKVQFWLVNFSDQVNPFILVQPFNDLINQREMPVGQYQLSPFEHLILEQR
ncbi:beta-galactosidase [Amphibacillus sediminis]|uniref:beta-galactosidase n=1 Tax=Amphibacillus sediminis TaxID=360185 RepID=UPI00082E7D86|nr:beta-galactosidase [Amphibacillus sediminis]